MTESTSNASQPNTDGATRVLVCGATGYLGGYVVKAAKARGYWVRALVRSAERYGDQREMCDDVFEGQATDPATLKGLCDGIDVVITSLGNRTLNRKPDCWDVDYGANRNIVESARQAGVKHFIFVSVFHGDRVRAIVPQIEARERVVDELKAGEMPWTIIRPSGFFNDMSEILQMAHGGSVWVIGTGTQLFNPIHGADLAEVCVDPINDVNSLGREIPAGGPGVLTMREVALAAFEAVGKEPKVRSFPLWALKATATVIKPFNINVASLLFMFMAFSDGDAVADQCGTHHLADFFKELVAASADETLAVRS